MSQALEDSKEPEFWTTVCDTSRNIPGDFLLIIEGEKVGLCNWTAVGITRGVWCPNKSLK